MKIKKIVCGVLACLMIMSLLVGCGKNKDDVNEGVLTASDIAIAAIAESKLSEDEMLSVVKEYYNVFNYLFEATGDNVVAEIVKNPDGTVVVNTSRPEIDENNKPTSKIITDEAVFSWGSVKEAFAYLYEQKQVDIDGKLMFSKEDVLAQMTQQAADDNGSAEESDTISSDVTTENVDSETKRDYNSSESTSAATENEVSDVSSAITE